MTRSRTRLVSSGHQPAWALEYHREVLIMLFVLQQAFGAASPETKPRRCSTSRRNSERETIDGSRSGGGGGRALQQCINQGRGCSHGMGNQRMGISQRRRRGKRAPANRSKGNEGSGKAGSGERSLLEALFKCPFC